MITPFLYILLGQAVSATTGNMKTGIGGSSSAVVWKKMTTTPGNRLILRTMCLTAVVIPSSA
jgi:hypothetical protein